MTRPTSLSVLLIVLTAGCAQHHRAASAVPPPSTGRYIDLLQQGIGRARTQMPAMIESAERAAKRIVAGHRIWLAGSQSDFAPELQGRAGGLEEIQFAPSQPDAGDVVLYGARSKLTVNDKLKISRWREHGVYVIAFTSRNLVDKYFPPDVVIDSGDSPGLPIPKSDKIIPADSVINIINGWTWTGEFVSACTRLGKMPVIYQSYGLDGARARAAKYRGKMFHRDVKVEPVPTGTLGSAYLDHLEQYLNALSAEAPPKLTVAAAWLYAIGRAGSSAHFMSQMYPHHFRDPRAPFPFSASANFQLEKTKPTPMTVLIGYQYAPQLLVDAAKIKRCKVLYTSVQRAVDDNTPDIIYLNPHWPLADACVDVKGYDIPILPASGVVQAAIYWSLIAEASQ